MNAALLRLGQTMLAELACGPTPLPAVPTGQARQAIVASKPEELDCPDNVTRVCFIGRRAVVATGHSEHPGALCTHLVGSVSSGPASFAVPSCVTALATVFEAAQETVVVGCGDGSLFELKIGEKPTLSSVYHHPGSLVAHLASCEGHYATVWADGTVRFDSGEVISAFESTRRGIVSCAAYDGDKVLICCADGTEGRSVILIDRKGLQGDVTLGAEVVATAPCHHGMFVLLLRSGRVLHLDTVSLTTAEVGRVGPPESAVGAERIYSMSRGMISVIDEAVVSAPCRAKGFIVGASGSEVAFRGDALQVVHVA